MKKYNSFEELKSLPIEVQREIAIHVGGKLYSEVRVRLENGKYSYSNGATLTRWFAPDFKIWDFHRDTVSQDSELNQIILAADAEYERWEREEGKDFDYEKLSQ